MTFTTTPAGKTKLEQEMKEFHVWVDDGPLPTLEELCAPLEAFFDGISDYAYLADSLGWLYDFGPRDEVRPRIIELRDLLAAVVDQTGYIVRGCVMGDTLNQAVILSSALRMVVEALSGATCLRDQIQALDDSEDYRAAHAKALVESGEVTPIAS